MGAPRADGERRSYHGGGDARSDGGFWRTALYAVLYMAATRTQIYLTAEQRKKIDIRRRREHKTLAAIVRDAVDAYLRAPEPRPDYQKVLDETFGSMPDLVVPSRDEWEERARRLGI